MRKSVGERDGSIDQSVQRALEAGALLRSVPIERIILGCVSAAETLLDSRSELGQRARVSLPMSTGLTTPMVEWALRSSLGSLTTDGLNTLVRSSHAFSGATDSAELTVPARLTALVLAGNVFTASLRGLMLPLLARSPVVAKASSRDDVFPRLLASALHCADDELFEACQIVTFAGGHTELEDKLFAQADAVSVYGSDATVESIRRRLSASTRLIAHGHGLGAAFIPRTALESEERIARCLENAALDVAAYDQRGCLSPHTIWIEEGGAIDARSFAERLARESLARLERDMPRGRIDTVTGAAQLQWRSVAVVRGELFEGSAFATSYEGDGPPRLSPGYRNVSVLTCGSEAALLAGLARYGVHLKALGVAASDGERRRIARSLPPALAPRISGLGAMQTPPFDAYADGLPAFHGLYRFIQID